MKYTDLLERYKVGIVIYIIYQTLGINWESDVGYFS